MEQENRETSGVTARNDSISVNNRPETVDLGGLIPRAAFILSELTNGVRERYAWS
jgi:hypothetical protein